MLWRHLLRRESCLVAAVTSQLGWAIWATSLISHLQLDLPAGPSSLGPTPHNNPQLAACRGLGFPLGALMLQHVRHQLRDTNLLLWRGHFLLFFSLKLIYKHLLFLKYTLLKGHLLLIFSPCYSYIALSCFLFCLPLSISNFQNSILCLPSF